MAFEPARWTCTAIVALCALGCSGAPHDLDLDDFSGEEPGATVGGNNGNGTGTGASSASTMTVGGGGQMTGGLSWNGNISGIVSANGCAIPGCHGGAAPQSNYSLETYAGALGVGVAPPANISGGDPTSLMVTKCNDGHQGIGVADAITIEEWVVAWDAQL